MAIYPLNNAVTYLRSPIGPGDVVLPFQTGTAGRFNVPSGDHVYLTLFDGTSFEVVRYDSTGPLASDNAPVTRGQDGTAPAAFPAGTCVAVRWNLAQVYEFILATAAGIVPTPSVSPIYFDLGGPPGALIPGYPFYFDTTSGTLYGWNGLGYVMIAITPDSLASTGAVDPVPATAGSIYFQTTSGALWVKISGSWTEVGMSYASIQDGLGAPGGPQPGYLYRDTVTGDFYIKVSGAWQPVNTGAVLPNIWPGVQRINSFEGIEVSQTGLVQARFRSHEFLTRSLPLGAPIAVAATIVGTPQALPTVVASATNTVLSAVGPGEIRVAPTPGKTAYVRFTANVVTYNPAPIGSDQIVGAVIRQAGVPGSNLLPSPVLAESAPSAFTSVDGSTAFNHTYNIVTPPIPFTAQTDIELALGASSAGFFLRPGAVGGVVFGAELLYQLPA